MARLLTGLSRLFGTSVPAGGGAAGPFEAYETILDALPDPVILLAEDRRIVRANSAARALLGDAPPGRALTSVLTSKGVAEAIEGVFAGARARAVEFSLHEPGHRDFTGRIQRLDVTAPDGSAVLISFHDMTEVKRMDRLRADFVANASHEIRTPLATLVGVIETLRGPARDDPEARERFLEMMDDHAQRITSLVGDLLSLSRIELVEHTPPDGKVDLGALLAETRESLDWKARTRDIRVELDIAPGLPSVKGDPDELGQTFQNLIDNAIKYGAPDSAVEVSARLSDAAADTAAGTGPVVAVAVRDHGVGIAREHIPRLTERFYRVDTARSRAMGGTGLGLAIVKHIVNRHRGRLEVESMPGEGSCFTVYLPAVAPGVTKPS